MSGTFVASATRASEKISYFLTAQSNAQNVTFSTITAQSGTFSNISTQNIEITSGKIGTGGGRFISTIGNELYYWDGSQLEQLTSVSSISSLGEWSLEPAISDVNLDGNNIYNVNTLECGNVSSLMGEFQTLVVQDLTTETLTVLSTIQTINYISTLELRANSGLFNTLSSGNAYVGQLSTNSLTTNTLSSGIAYVENLSGNIANFNTISSGSINVPGFNTSSITVQNLSSITGYIQALQVSSINGSEFTSNTVTVSSINTDNILTQNISSATATLTQAFISTLTFDPSFSGNLGPNISVDMGMGDFVGSLIGGLIGVGVTVPAGIFAIIGGLVSLIAPRPINNINNSVYEQINMTTQLQVSTLGEQFSTIFRGLSSTVSTISGNPETVNFEIFTSTISSTPPVVAMRSVGDPLQLVSTPWTQYQAFSQWVEIPSGTSGSNLNLSTLTLLQSTLLRAEPGPGGILQVLEAQNPTSYGQVEAQSYSMGATLTGSNGILFYQDLLDRPGFLDDGAGVHTLAYLTDIPGTQDLAATLLVGNSAGGCNINMNTNSLLNVSSITASASTFLIDASTSVLLNSKMEIQSDTGKVEFKNAVGTLKGSFGYNVATDFMDLNGSIGFSMTTVAGPINIEPTDGKVNIVTNGENIEIVGNSSGSPPGPVVFADIIIQSSDGEISLGTGGDIVMIATTTTINSDTFVTGDFTLSNAAPKLIFDTTTATANLAFEPTGSIFGARTISADTDEFSVKVAPGLGVSMGFFSSTISTSYVSGTGLPLFLSENGANSYSGIFLGDISTLNAIGIDRKDDNDVTNSAATMFFTGAGVVTLESLLSTGSISITTLDAAAPISISAGSNLSMNAGGDLSLSGANITCPTLTSARAKNAIYYDPSTFIVTQESAFPVITVQAATGTVALTESMNRETFILTGTSATQTFTNAGLAGVASGWCVYLRNGNNATGASQDITITISAGSVTLHAPTGSTNSSFVLLFWDGTALVAYI